MDLILREAHGRPSPEGPSGQRALVFFTKELANYKIFVLAFNSLKSLGIFDLKKLNFLV